MASRFKLYRMYGTPLTLTRKKRTNITVCYNRIAQTKNNDNYAKYWQYNWLQTDHPKQCMESQLHKTKTWLIKMADEKHEKTAPYNNMNVWRQNKPNRERHRPTHSKHYNGLGPARLRIQWRIYPVPLQQPKNKK